MTHRDGLKPVNSKGWNPNLMDEMLGSLQVEQLKILNALFNCPNRTGFILGQKKAAHVGVLSTKGLITRAGKIGKRTRWKVSSDFFTKENRDLIRELSEGV